MDKLSERGNFLYFFAGSLPLCLKSSDNGQGPQVPTKHFDKLLSKVRDRLETFPNVKIIEFNEKSTDFGVRFPRRWAPVGDAEELEAGPWTFSEYISPLIFAIHLPGKIQSSLFPSLFDLSRVEDFTVAYNGMLFMGIAECHGERDMWSPAPTVRKYMQSDLFKEVDDFTPVLIPPSPLHLTFEIRTRTTTGPNDGPAERISLAGHTVHISTSTEKLENTAALLRELYYGLNRDLTKFYHLMIERSVADDLYQEILKTSQNVQTSYKQFLETWPCRIVRKSNQIREISKAIGDVHFNICEHSLALISLEESRRSFLKDVRENKYLEPARDYFTDMAKPEAIHYSVFLSSLEHTRSHLLVLTQNRFLLYAALVGSIATILGAVFGLLIHR
jgi:hypothetical protein